MISSDIRSDQRGSGIIAVVLVLAVGLAVVLVAINALSASRVNRARLGWDDSLGDWDEIMQRFPANEANAAALEVERLSAELGIDTAPRHDEDRVRPTKEQRQLFEVMKPSAFGPYYRSQLERARRGAIDAPPPALVTYIAAHEEQLEALRHQLLTGETPLWESDLSRLAEAPLPNLLGQINLHKLFTNLAFERIHSGDTEGALEHIQASWNLARSLDNSPALISQLIRIAATRMQLGALRHVSDVPELWIDRLAQADFREPFVTAMKYEGWIWLYLDDSEIWNTGSNWWRRLVGPAVQPYTQLCLADLSNAWRERLVNLERVEALCDFDLATYDADLEIPIPRWNLIDVPLVPNLTNAMDRLARLELDLELTRLLLVTDADRRANPGEWPSDNPVDLPSTACPGEHWRLSHTAGRVEIAFSREIHWEDSRGAILPTRAVMN